MTTLLTIVGMFAAFCLVTYVHAGRTWDRAYELGWQHGRRQMESDAELARFQARRRQLEVAMRDDRAVN